MRRDGISVYGGPSSTPNLDSFATDGMTYNECIAPSPWTFPSHVSMFVGSYPSQHGLHESYDAKGTEFWHRQHNTGANTIAESLRKIGYNTIGISANLWLYPDTIFSKGFNFFSTIEEERISSKDREVIRRASKYGKSPREILWKLLIGGKIGELYELYSTYRKIQTKKRMSNYPTVKGGNRVSKILAKSSFEEPFFLFLNFFEMHDPYTAYEESLANGIIDSKLPGLSLLDLLEIKEIPPNAMTEIRNQYFQESSCVDSFFGELISYLKMKDLYDGSLIITTSDHGQALKERNYYGHSTYLYDEIVRVPLIVKYPGNMTPSIKSGYQSLIYIPRLIEGLIENNSGSDLMTEDVVFSESFGIPNQTIREIPEDIRKRFDISRKAVFKKGYKMTVNWTEMTIEELAYKGKHLDPSENKDVCDSLLNEFSVLKESETKAIKQDQSIVFSQSEESEMMEKLRNMGYA